LRFYLALKKFVGHQQRLHSFAGVTAAGRNGLIGRCL
jgi:hypothetical protein